LRRPDLEAIYVRLRHHAAVQGEPVAFLAKVLASLLPAEIAERCNEYLQCREPLLAVYDLASFDMRARRQLLIENHGAEEMHRSIFPAVEMLDEFAGYVFPKRLPLLIPAPDILPLKKRDFEPHFLFKNCEQRNGVGIHIFHRCV
jgi:hypothetical protein